MIIFCPGNILDAKAYALVNTVNTVGVMGKGIALQFKNAFPHNYQVYCEACKNHRLHVGNLLIVKDRSLIFGERLIINFPTKTHWRLPSEYTYIENGLAALANLLTQQNLKEVALPALGCGNGGLEWSIVKQMIYQHMSCIDAMIEIYQPVQ